MSLDKSLYHDRLHVFFLVIFPSPFSPHPPFFPVSFADYFNFQIKVPTMIIHGEKDDIAYPQGSRELEGLLSSSTSKRLKVYDGLLHEVLNHKAHFESIMADLQAFWDSP